MADPHWTNYIGMTTGLVGTILGYLGYKTSRELKHFDLRLELRKSINSAHMLYENVADLIKQANQSRQRVAAASGQTKSGMMAKWESSVEADSNLLDSLYEELPKQNESFTKLSQSSLEENLVVIHGIQLKLETLQEK